MTMSTPTTGDRSSGNAAAPEAAAGPERTSGHRPAGDGERADLLATLGHQRHFMRFTTRGLTDDQARQATTVSELCLGGLIKHVKAAEESWATFILEGPSAKSDFSGLSRKKPTIPVGIVPTTMSSASRSSASSTQFKER